MATQLTDFDLESKLHETQDPEKIRKALIDAMINVVGKDPDYASPRDWYYALAYYIRGILSRRYIHAARAHYSESVKRLYYLSMEYLPGRAMTKHLLDLGLLDPVQEALSLCEQDYAAVSRQEFDQALGNGGLGRLAACLMDSMATHDYPGNGYGIRYEYGMFTQRIENGQQMEHPENWLRYGNPWEFERPSVIYPIRFRGRIIRYRNEKGEHQAQWVDTDEVIAMAFDVPVSGFGTEHVSNLRLWSAKSSRDFDLSYFNEGNYMDAVRTKTLSENLSRVLYPNDKTQRGQELRLMQEYFFVSASIQDVLSRFLRSNDDLANLPNEVCLQLNDTHPALGVPELLRLLVDVYGYEFEEAAKIVEKTFAYTNHTLLPEALETWSIDLLGTVLPRHLELIFELNDRFLRQVRRAFPGDQDIVRRVSMVDDGAHSVRMAHVAIVGSHKVNGVAALHSELLRTRLFADFNKIYPGKIINITNGITQRAWLLESNPALSAAITNRIGAGWKRDLSELAGLASYAEDADFHAEFAAIKKANKERLATFLADYSGKAVNTEALFDIQVKRIHEYKRQLLNVLHIITRYNQIKDSDGGSFLPRVIHFGGKAAPGYFMAKLIIRLILDVAETVNNDPHVGDLLHVSFWPNYNASAAQIIIPAANLSEQISTAGTEASGTGNMKFALNGALTIGTLDGANIEIKEEVGDDNIFIFGMKTPEVEALRLQGYEPWQYYSANTDLKRALDMIDEGYFSPQEPFRYKPIIDALLRGGDHYMLLADYESYMACQQAVDEAYLNQEAWTKMAILNVANMGKFSSDRTVHDYAREIWGIKPQPVG
ncbi:MAG: glycogen/starch/alpha-glucan phosphorylase [Magnetospiraceae bacterium]